VVVTFILVLQLPADIRWHFIGHLQSNKAKSLADIPNLFLVHTVHSGKLATQLNKLFAATTPKLRVMAQVNTSGEDSQWCPPFPSRCFPFSSTCLPLFSDKSGVLPGEIVDLVRHIRDTCDHLEFAGLMTIGDSIMSSEVKTRDNPNPDFKVRV